MAKLCTSIEQSKKLVELGLNTNTADMYWIKHWGKEIPRSIQEGYEGKILSKAWSLTALFGLLPILGTGEDTLNPFLAKTPTGEYYVVYTTLTEEKVCSNTRINAIDAVYEMVAWLLENGNLKKKE